MWHTHYGAIVKTGTAYLENKDRILLGQEILSAGQAERQDLSRPVAVIFDGVGGTARSSAASIAAEFFRNSTENYTIAGGIANMTIQISQAVCNSQDRNPANRNMVISLAGLALSDDRFAAFNVGDTQIYRYDTRGLKQLSSGNRLTQEGSPWIPAQYHGHLANTPVSFVLCSNSISQAVPEADMLKILEDNSSPLNICRTMLKKAGNNGSADSMSIIVIKRQKD